MNADRIMSAEIKINSIEATAYVLYTRVYIVLYDIVMIYYDIMVII